MNNVDRRTKHKIQSPHSTCVTVFKMLASLDIDDATGPPVIVSKYPLYVEIILSSSSNLTVKINQIKFLWSEYYENLPITSTKPV